MADSAMTAARVIAHVKSNAGHRLEEIGKTLKTETAVPEWPIATRVPSPPSAQNEPGEGTAMDERPEERRDGRLGRALRPEPRAASGSTRQRGEASHPSVREKTIARYGVVAKPMRFLDVASWPVYHILKTPVSRITHGDVTCVAWNCPVAPCVRIGLPLNFVHVMPSDESAKPILNLPPD
jgi:hypothetical protein